MTIPNFDVYRSEDGLVSKYIHEDGSETAIKLSRSIQNVVNPLTKTMETHHTERNKFSIFISSSVGCFMRCKFCHLTLKNAKHFKLEADQILSNLQEAFLDSYALHPELAQKYVKLSWMGMGDAINKSDMVYDVTKRFLDWLFEQGYVRGLDGVDLSTVMPKMSSSAWMGHFHALEAHLANYPRNPAYAMDNVQYTNGAYTHRNIFRLFYSIESAVQSARDVVIPNAMPLEQAVALLREYQQDGKYTVILHHLLVNDLNDSEVELEALAQLMTTQFPGNELRILRYNLCAKSMYKESDRFLQQIRYLSEHIGFIKVQVSPGSEVSAACGQFIVKDFIRLQNSGLKSSNDA